MHKLLTDNPGQKMLMLGNEAIARGAIEAGAAFTASYPGTPSSEISLNFFQMSKESDLYFEYSINEKVSVEVTAAAANCGVRSMCVMKHVGMNVAADALLTLAYIGVKGGMVILTADDPFMFSSQNEQDNRYYAKLAGLPVLEPSSVAEAKEMTKQAFELSETLGEPVILRTTTRINHSTGVVELGEIKKPITKGDFERDPMRCVTVPAVSRGLHVKLLENLAKAEEMACTSPWNMVDGKAPLGVIANGVSYTYVKDGLADLGATDNVKVLRLGFSLPMPKNLVLDFIKGCEKVLIVEEGEPVMEEAVKAVAQENGLTLPICGKGEKLFSRLYEFDPKMVRNILASYFDLAPVASESVDLAGVPPMPNRPPNLCAGCSHRATFYAVKKATEGMDVMFPSDIGCYTLGFMPPLSTGDFVLCMGASTSTSAGFATVTDKKVISFVGDSTFFHSGIMGLMNAVFNNHNFTLVILDNRITGMTGHQPNPGVDMDEMGFEGYNSIDIEGLVKAAGVKHVSVVRPYNLKKSAAAIKEAVAFEGVSVVIAKEKCTLYAKSLKQLTGKKFQVNPEKCKDHRDCIDTIACPAFTTEGGRVRIIEDMCAGCSICAQICPENAIMPVKK
ncbi:indolepyruvate oxidoreductase subunit IorA [Desulfoluna limicola]|uniref:Indolepyruvate oxidoreductase subunit IorA n=1 Tax=Desulfoluna limicola TaxID=2810562 RepID=A0ABN6F8V1_9BACT|nr:indolepyruvate ferredoxin oxidoreductase subunit alpha [Desulfoluna limicola]BCS98774.1 indolepyruvate oxidoreductase subunit IorA [Desulfoluna limicola]